MKKTISIITFGGILMLFVYACSVLLRYETG